MVTAAEVAEALGSKRKRRTRRQATRNELNTWNELRRSGEYDELLDRMGNKRGVKDAMCVDSRSCMTITVAVKRPWIRRCSSPCETFYVPEDRPKPADPDFALHSDIAMPSAKRTPAKRKNCGRAIRIRDRRKRATMVY